MFVSETKDHICLSGEDEDRGLFKLRFTMFFFMKSAKGVMYDINPGVQVSCSNCEISIQRHKYEIFSAAFFF